MQINDTTMLTQRVRSDILPQYASDAAFAAALGYTPTEGMWYFNTTVHSPKFYGESWQQLSSKIVNFRIDGFIRIITGLETTTTEAMAIRQIVCLREVAGTSGITTLDINKNGTTIFTDQGLRPVFSATSGNLQIVTVVPSIGTYADDDLLSIDIDTVEAGDPQNISIKIYS